MDSKTENDVAINLLGNQDRVPHQNEAVIANNLVSYFEETPELADAELRRDYLGHLSKEDFITELQTVNGIIRGRTDRSLQPFDGEGVVLATHDTPRQEDKESALGDVWTGVQELLTDSSLDAATALEYAGALVGLGILYTHPLEDSNGRTSRTMSRLIREGTGPRLEIDLEGILGKDGAAYERLFIPSFPGYINDAIPNSSYNRDDRSLQEGWGTIRRFNFGLEDAPRKYEDIAKNEDVITNFAKSFIKYPVMITFLKHIDREAFEKIKTHVRDETLYFGEALEELANGERGIEYMSQLRDADRYVRNEFIKRFTKTMTSGVKTKLRAEERRDMEWARSNNEVAPPTARKLGELLIAKAIEGPEGDEIAVRDLIIAGTRAYSHAKPTRAAA